jgi:hypothetical protein
MNIEMMVLDVQKTMLENYILMARSAIVNDLKLQSITCSTSKMICTNVSPQFSSITFSKNLSNQYYDVFQIHCFAIDHLALYLQVFQNLANLV